MRNLKHTKGKLAKDFSLTMTSCVILRNIKDSDVINVIHNSEKSHTQIRLSNIILCQDMILITNLCLAVP